MLSSHEPEAKTSSLIDETTVTDEVWSLKVLYAVIIFTLRSLTAQESCMTKTAVRLKAFLFYCFPAKTTPSGIWVKALRNLKNGINGLLLYS